MMPAPLAHVCFTPHLDLYLKLGRRALPKAGKIDLVIGQFHTYTYVEDDG